LISEISFLSAKRKHYEGTSYGNIVLLAPFFHSDYIFFGADVREATMAVVSVVVVHVHYTLHGVFGLFLIAQKLLLYTPKKFFLFILLYLGGLLIYVYVCMDLLGAKGGNYFKFLI
jgi:hypothetical protein